MGRRAGAKWALISPFDQPAGPDPAGPDPAGRQLVGFELVRVSVPLRRPWATASGSFSERDSLLVRAVVSLRDTNGDRQVMEGWGECGALPGPTYSSEYTAAATEVSERYLVPWLLRARVTRAAEVWPALSGARGHHMAKAAFEAALLDVELRASGQSMADYFSARSAGTQPARAAVTAGVAVGLANDTHELLDEVGEYVGYGYKRVKLKISPERDAQAVSAVRKAWPDLVLFADANGSYQTLSPTEATERLSALDDFGLACLEQPLGADDLRGHAQLVRRLRTPICLDETLTSYNAVVTALDTRACSVVNIKAGRLGGYLAAVRVHDLCASRQVPVWCGGMVETGIARAANVALAALPGFCLPGDLSATGRFFETDLTSPLPLRHDGTIAVPRGPGIGVVVDQEAVRLHCTWRYWWPAR